MRQPPNSLHGNEQGQSMVEFTFVAITFLFVMLGVIQLAMALNAYSLVRYAAYNAARAAIVHSGDPDTMQEAARVSLLATFPRHGRADHRLGFMENYFGARETDSEPDLTFFNKPITEVEVVNSQDFACGTVVTFDDPADSELAHLTVQVVHRYELVIPLVNRLIFWLYHKLELGGTYSGESLDFVARETHRRRKSGGEYHDIEYRIPLVAHYTMRLQSDYAAEECPPPPTPEPTPVPTPVPPPPPTPEPTPCLNNYNYCGHLEFGFACPVQYCQIPSYALPFSCLNTCCGNNCVEVPGMSGYHCWSFICYGAHAGAPCFCI